MRAVRPDVGSVMWRHNQRKNASAVCIWMVHIAFQLTADAQADAMTTPNDTSTLQALPCMRF